jgi:hypothetical protein
MHLETRTDMKKVYIVNKSAHDFSEAENYGQIIFLSSGSVNRYQTNSMIRTFVEVMVDSTPEDYIVPCSLNVMNSIACAIFAHKHGTLNLLLYRQGKGYIERNHVL